MNDDIRGRLRRTSDTPAWTEGAELPPAAPAWADPDEELRQLAGRIEMSAPAPAFKRRTAEGEFVTVTYPVVSSSALLDSQRYGWQFFLLIDRDTEHGAHFAVLSHDIEYFGGGSLRVTSRHRSLDEALDVINDRVRSLSEGNQYTPKPGTGPVVLTREQVAAEAKQKAGAS